MKLASDSLISIIEILRRGLIEQLDISDSLRELDLEVNAEGKLGLTESYRADELFAARSRDAKV